MTENKKYNAIAFRCWIEEKGYKNSTTGWFETIYADAPGPYTSRKISHVAKTDSELYDIFATSQQEPESVCPICDGRGRVSYYTGEDGGKEKGEQVEVTPEAAALAKDMMTDLAAKVISSSQDPDDSASYEKWLDKSGLYAPDIHVGDIPVQQVEGKGEGASYAIPQKICNACGGQVPDDPFERVIHKEGGYEHYFCSKCCDQKKHLNPQISKRAPSVEADRQVPRQSIADVCGNIPVAEAFKIAKWADVEMESLQHQVSTLKESFKSSIYQHDQDMEIVKGERDELCDLLNILNEGYSDHFTKFLNDRIYEALNRFTNNTKDNEPGTKG